MRYAEARRTGLSFQTPFAAAELFSFLAARAIPGVEEVTGTRYRRTTAAGVVAVEWSSAGVTLDGAATPAVARHLLDLDADPNVVDGHLSRSPMLQPLVARRPGLRVPGAWDGFEMAVRAVLGQQITVAAASTLAGRLVAAYGTPLRGSVGTVTHVFPGPEVLAAADLAAVGMPHRRRDTIRALAAAVAAGGLVLKPGADTAAVRRALLGLPGIGPWTAEYIAMRALGDPDAFPSSDLGLQRAYMALGARPPLEEAAEEWRPWRAYAAMHLWASLG